ncbi:MAG: tail fiber domain-containing protein [Oligoflexia bacterium]|nr:tail fiber domain-containing protein [Oligoflexia bacterium]
MSYNHSLVNWSASENNNNNGWYQDFSNGNENVNTTNPTAKLHVYQTGGAGTVISKFINDAATCSVTDAGMSCASDVRLKTDIQPIEHGLDKVRSLDGVTFRWKNGSASDQRSMGFIAQEVEKVAPELVRNDKDSGFKQVNYSNFVALLTQAVKELYNKIVGVSDNVAAMKIENIIKDRQIQSLQQENFQMKNENAAIKARLEKIEKALQSK